MFENDVVPASCTCSSEHGIEKLIEATKRLSHGNGFVLVLDGSVKTERFLPACANAYMRMKESAARSKSMQMEVLLFIAGNMNIGNAIRAAGAKDPGDFIALASSAVLLKKFLKATDSRVVRRQKLVLDMNVSGDVSILPIISDK